MDIDKELEQLTCTNGTHITHIGGTTCVECGENISKGVDNS